MLANSVDPDQTPRFSICLVKKHDGQKASAKKHAPWKHSLTYVTVGTFKLYFSLDYHLLMGFQL